MLHYGGRNCFIYFRLQNLRSTGEPPSRTNILEHPYCYKVQLNIETSRIFPSVHSEERRCVWAKVFVEQGMQGA